MKCKPFDTQASYIPVHDYKEVNLVRKMCQTLEYLSAAPSSVKTHKQCGWFYQISKRLWIVDNDHQSSWNSKKTYIGVFWATCLVRSEGVNTYREEERPSCCSHQDWAIRRQIWRRQPLVCLLRESTAMTPCRKVLESAQNHQIIDITLFRHLENIVHLDINILKNIHLRREHT